MYYNENMNTVKIRHRQKRDGIIVQTAYNRDDQERDDNCACNSLHRPVLVRSVIVYAELSLSLIDVK